MTGNRQMPELRFTEVGTSPASSGKPRRMAWWDWPAREGADPDRVVVCVHGLSRQGRDFDVLAASLTDTARVVCVDVAGRGHSDWLDDPTGYQLSTYANDIAVLLAALRSAQERTVIDWVGTSMGGLIGIALASQPAMAIRRLVLNDVGPVIQWDALLRIGAYLGADPSFASEAEAAAYLRSISQGFGPHSDAQWMALTLPMLRRRGDGWRLHYDPSIAIPVRALIANPDPQAAREVVQAGESALWALYDHIQARTLLLRGAESDLLTRDTARSMGVRGPRPQCIEFAGVGHAPTLVSDDQVAAVREFLSAP